MGKFYIHERETAGTFAIEYVNDNDFLWTEKVIIRPRYWDTMSIYSTYEVKHTIPANTNKTIEVTIPRATRQEWFHGFDGGEIRIDIIDDSGREYTHEDLVFNHCLWSSYSFANLERPSTSPLPSINNDAIEFCLIKYEDRYEHPIPVWWIAGANKINYTFGVRFKGEHECQVKDIWINDWLGTGFNQSWYSSYSHEYENDIYTASIENIYSPNITISVNFDIDLGYYSTNGEKAIFNTNLRLKATLPLQEYAAPVVYAEVKSPMDANGDGVISIAGRAQAFLKNTSNTETVNSLTSCAYKVMTVSPLQTIIEDDLIGSVIIDGDVFSVELELSGLDYYETYKISITVKDSLGNFNITSIALTNRPVFDWNHESFNFNIPVYHQGDIFVNGESAIHGMRSLDNYGSYETKNIFTPLDSTGNTVIGYDHFQQESGNTLIYGNRIDIMAHEDITINGESITDLVEDTSTSMISETIANEVPTIATNIATAVVTQTLSNRFGNILWEGSNTMGDEVQITLNDKISNQVSGIVLVFCRYDAQNTPVSWNSHFVSRHLINGWDDNVANLTQYGGGHVFLMANNAALATFGAKYLYITNKAIRGQSSNTQSGTAASGITFNNADFYLKYVIGV